MLDASPTAFGSAPVRLLVSGDLHLGRAPSRVPVGDRALSVEAVVRALVDRAIEQRVDAVVLTGDLADADNRLFEAYGVLERQLRRLSAARVPLVFVAGNHDHDVAGRLADALGGSEAGVHLLGRGQRWETTELSRDGRPVLRLAGWSFAGPHHEASPLQDFPALDPALPTVGVLHADLAPQSAYAPVSLAELRAKPVAAWLLGHVHAPALHAMAGEAAGAPVLYPGSPQPLDPGEPGVHGAWLVEVSAGAVRARLVPLATVQYARLDVDLGTAETTAELRASVLDAVRERAASARAENPALRHLSLRLRLVGRTAAFAETEALAAELRADAPFAAGGLDVSVDTVENAARPALALDHLAVGSGPVATLAGLALRLDAAATPEALGDADRRLLDRTAEAVRAARRAAPFEPLAAAARLTGDPETEALGRLRHQTRRLLDAALAQTT